MMGKLTSSHACGIFILAIIIQACYCPAIQTDTPIQLTNEQINTNYYFSFINMRYI